MDVVDPVGNEVDDLFCSIGDSGLFHGPGIVGKFVRDGLETGGKSSSRQFTGAFDLTGVGDRHHSRDYRDADIFGHDPVKEAEEYIVVEKHLRR